MVRWNGGRILLSSSASLNVFQVLSGKTLAGACLRLPLPTAILNHWLMVTPCKKCGAEKTEDVHHGILYELAKVFGYRLRMCSRCHRLRVVPRHPRHTDEKPTTGSATPPPSYGTCPKCGKTDYRRSRRLLWEHLIFRGPMVRCRACRTRYPQPRSLDMTR